MKLDAQLKAANGPRLGLVLLLLLLSALSFGMHPASMASARAKISVDGSYQVFVRFDILAYCLDLPPSEIADGPMNALLDGPAAELDRNLVDAKARFLREMRILGGGAAAKFDSFSFPSTGEVKETAGTAVVRLPVMMVVEIRGHLPANSKTASLAFPGSLGSVVLTTEFPYQEPVTEPVEPGQTSRALNIPTEAQVAAVQASIDARGVSESKAAVKAPVSPAVKPLPQASVPAKQNLFADARADAVASSTLPQAPQPFATQPIVAAKPKLLAPAVEEATPAVQLPSQRLAWYEVFPNYVKMGFVHIVPLGLDHILFVLGLFLLSTRTKDLLKQITAFTVAHSLTLALSLYGVVRLPASVVEPIIALSIVFVAVENLVSKKMHKWRTGVVFLFGLMHGLGFASALREVGLSQGDFLTGLLGFNCGVELGQLTVVGGALVLVGWFRTHRNYRPLVAVPASVVIALVAAVWTVERLL